MDSTIAQPTPPPSARLRRLTPKGIALIALGVLVLVAVIVPIFDSPGPRAVDAGSGQAVAARDARASGQVATVRTAAAAVPAALGAAHVPVDVNRAQRVAAATLVLVDGRSGLARSVDRARADLTAFGGHTVSFNETEGRPTSTDPCPVPIDVYSSGGLRPVAFPCPAPGRQSDSAQLVMAVPVGRVQGLLRRMDGYGEILGRATQIVDAQQSLDAGAAQRARLERQITRLRDLIAATGGDTSALRAQLADRVAQVARLEDARAATRNEVRFAQVALNLTTVRPPDKPAAHNWFVGAVQTGWHRLARLARRLVTLLVIVLPIVALVSLIGLPFVIRRRRRGSQPPAPTA